jgi:hypothetical protein
MMNSWNGAVRSVVDASHGRRARRRGPHGEPPSRCRRCRHSRQVLLDQLVDPFRLLDRGDMRRGPTISCLAPRDRRGDHRLAIDRRSEIVRARDHKRRRDDPRNVAAEVHPLDRPAAGRPRQAATRPASARARPEPPGERPRSRGSANARRSARSIRRRVQLQLALARRMPAACARRCRSGSGGRPGGSVRSQPHPDRPADRQVAVGDVIESERIHQLQHVHAGIGDLVGRRRNR